MKDINVEDVPRIEQEILDFGKKLLNDVTDVKISENVAKIYRNMLFHSRASTLERIEETISFLEGMHHSASTGKGEKKTKTNGAGVAFISLLGQDQTAAFMLVDRIDSNDVQIVLSHVLTLTSVEPVTLYLIWQRLVDKVPIKTKTKNIDTYVSLSLRYCERLGRADTNSAFLVFLQTLEWFQLSKKSKSSRALLTQCAAQLIVVGREHFPRMSELVWKFVDDDDDSRKLSDEVGIRTKTLSLVAAVTVLRNRIVTRRMNEKDIKEMSERAASWMTEDLKFDENLDNTSKIINSLSAAIENDSLVKLKGRLDSVLDIWKDRDRQAAIDSIEFVPDPPKWIDFSPYRADWVEIDTGEEVRNRLWPLTAWNGISSSGLTIQRIRSVNPTFYPDFKLIEIQIPSINDKSRICALLIKESQTVVLTGESSPIHYMNGNGSLKNMDDEVVVFDYFKFFCGYVWSDEGPFRVITEMKDIPFIAAGELDKKGKDAIAKFIIANPPEIERLEDYSWKVVAPINYGNALYKASFTVQTTGQIEMDEDQPFFSNLPVRKVVSRNGLRSYLES